MNLLQNKKLLKALLKQSDLLNTINGGVSAAQLKKSKSGTNQIITLKIPGVKPEALQVVLNGSELIIFAVPTFGTQENKVEDIMAVPQYLYREKLAKTIDTEDIEAIHENGELKVILPQQEQKSNNIRQIKVRHI